MIDDILISLLRMEVSKNINIIER